MMDYILAGKPILAAVDEDGDAARCIREAGCGWVVQPDNAQALAEGFRAVLAIAASALAKMGNAGAVYGAVQFSKTTGLARMSDVVESVLGQRRNGRGGAA